jgi:SSS family solute:Na+ symporter/sodium/proline symporter
VDTQDEFVVGGRRMSTFVLIGTLLATWIGTGSVLGGAGLAYRMGFSALWFSAGAWSAIVILYLIAGRARAFAQYTVPDMLEARYGPAARVLGTLVTIVAYTAIVSYQYRGGGMVLNLVTGMDVETAILVTAVFIVLYTAIAGIVSIAYTDVVNGVILIAGLVLTFGHLAGERGGPGALFAALPPEKLAPLGTLTLAQGLGLALPALVLILGEANMYQRFFSAASSRAAERSVVGWLAGTIFVETLIVAIAVAGSLDLPGLDTGGGRGTETIILRLVTDVLPVGLGALLLAAVLGVIVDTGDSFLLIPATSLVHDIYRRFVNPEVSQRAAAWLLRGVVVLLGLLAWGQLRFFDTILQMALYAYTMYGAGVTPAVLAAFFWKRATPAGGVASIAAGMLTTLAWEALKRAGAVPPALAAYDTVFFALAASVTALVLVSLATPAPPESRWRPFFQTDPVPETKAEP